MQPNWHSIAGMSTLNCPTQSLTSTLHIQGYMYGHDKLSMSLTSRRSKTFTCASPIDSHDEFTKVMFGMTTGSARVLPTHIRVIWQLVPQQRCTEKAVKVESCKYDGYAPNRKNSLSEEPESLVVALQLRYWMVSERLEIMLHRSSRITVTVQLPSLHCRPYSETKRQVYPDHGVPALSHPKSQRQSIPSRASVTCTCCIDAKE